ncbi:MAG: hypothetical protein QOD86_2791 [Miltoncostaeaceae bacterium]|jgi:uncharacterized protein (DUF488 family)|nr:hypothetical protein [Miltoncostaeaceae bacterium]
MRGIATIGVYGFALEGFLAALRGAGVDLLVDVRRRRGVRGHEYAWANAGRLQEELAGAGIGYRHLIELAPPVELIRLQSRADDAAGIARRARAGLGEAFLAGYERDVLRPTDWDAVAASLADAALPALLCVERVPEACHRALAAEALAAAAGMPVTHLLPPG